MIPGEILVPLDAPPLAANVGLVTRTLVVANAGDRPVQVGSHFHFYEVNPALRFDREAARGDQRQVELVALAGERRVYGLNGKIEGPL